MRDRITIEGRDGAFGEARPLLAALLGLPLFDGNVSSAAGRLVATRFWLADPGPAGRRFRDRGGESLWRRRPGQWRRRPP